MSIPEGTLGPPPSQRVGITGCHRSAATPATPPRLLRNPPFPGPNHLTISPRPAATSFHGRPTGPPGRPLQNTHTHDPALGARDRICPIFHLPSPISQPARSQSTPFGSPIPTRHECCSPPVPLHTGNAQHEVVMMGQLPGTFRALREPGHTGAFTFPPNSPASSQRFTFAALQASVMTSTPSPLDHPTVKRPRPLADVDGECSEPAPKKKRRLRLLLVTSRLSRPYSAPPTHIVGRGSSKIAIWAKQKALGRSSLRKAALLNRVRRRGLEEASWLGGGPARRWSASGHSTDVFMYGYHATVTTLFLEQEPRAEEDARPRRSPDLGPRRQHLPLPPSPLSLTNYDAIDEEDVFSDDEEGDGGSLVYSDWNILEPTEPVTADHDALSEFADASFLGELLDTPEAPVDEIVEERERQKQVAFVEFGY